MNIYDYQNSTGCGGHTASDINAYEQNGLDPIYNHVYS